jgi:hypothetical protein
MTVAPMPPICPTPHWQRLLTEGLLDTGATHALETVHVEVLIALAVRRLKSCVHAVPCDHSLTRGVAEKQERIVVETIKAWITRLAKAIESLRKKPGSGT